MNAGTALNAWRSILFHYSQGSDMGVGLAHDERNSLISALNCEEMAVPYSGHLSPMLAGMARRLTDFQREPTRACGRSPSTVRS